MLLDYIKHINIDSQHGTYTTKLISERGCKLIERIHVDKNVTVYYLLLKDKNGDTISESSVRLSSAYSEPIQNKDIIYKKMFNNFMRIERQSKQIYEEYEEERPFNEMAGYIKEINDMASEDGIDEYILIPVVMGSRHNPIQTVAIAISNVNVDTIKPLVISNVFSDKPMVNLDLQNIEDAREIFDYSIGNLVDMDYILMELIDIMYDYLLQDKDIRIAELKRNMEDK